MISAWQVYVVMQADAVITSAILAALICGFVGGALLACGFSDENASVVKIGKRVIGVATVAAVIATFLPDSKTMAAMLVIPALTSQQTLEVVEPEAREVYELAKDALRELGKKDEKAEKEK